MKTQILGILAWSKWNEKKVDSAQLVPMRRKLTAMSAGPRLRSTSSTLSATAQLRVGKKFEFGNQEVVSAFANN